MKKSLKVFVLCFVCALGFVSPKNASAHSPASGGSGWGAGFVLGNISGLSARMWAAPNRAWDFALAYSVDDYVSFMASHNWVFSNALPKDFKNIHFHPFLGVGGFLSFIDGTFDNDLSIGIRMPVGLEFVFPTIPLGISVELAPVIPLYPNTDVDLHAFLGVRFYF